MATVSLQKGGNVSLTKVAPELESLAVGLGWDPRESTGAAFDLDASVFMLNEQGKVPNTQCFVYYGNLNSPDHSVRHQGDNLTGEGEGDDEVVDVYLNRIPAEVVKLLFTVTIYQAEQRHQTFGMVQNAFIRLVNKDNNQEIARYDLGEEFSLEVSMIFGELYRYKGEWKFRAVGQGFKSNLQELSRMYS